MKKFELLTLKGQKMRIVRDALLQIQEKVIIPKEGDYLEMIVSAKRGKSLQDLLLQNNGPVCEVCAKGALFAGCVLNVNDAVVGKSIEKESFQSRKLSKWFSQKELDMIETAFEYQVIGDGADYLFERYTRKSNVAESCIRFGKRRKTDKGRLRAILKNILKNGEFTP